MNRNHLDRQINGTKTNHTMPKLAMQPTGIAPSAHRSMIQAPVSEGGLRKAHYEAAKTAKHTPEVLPVFHSSGHLLKSHNIRFKLGFLDTSPLLDRGEYLSKILMKTAL